MMTVHVLHAGDGYTYLTRQVASADEVQLRGEKLKDYYTASGNPPGRWVGSAIGDLGVSGIVEEAQMRALFGEGRHPRADEITAEMLARGASAEEVLEATQLGRAMPTFKNPTDEFDAKVFNAFAEFNRNYDRSPTPGPEADLVRWNVIQEHLTQQFGGRPPSDIEARQFLAQRGAKIRQPVSGLDLVFTPPKSISVFWALSEEKVSRQFEEAHEAAWRGAITWLEKEAALTRVGAGGIAQVNTTGFVAAAFDHIDSRAGDPNLHTHVAIANRVLGQDGKWRALDARTTHYFGVAASERYATLLEVELTRRLGVQFVDVAARKGGQPVREIASIPRRLCEHFSQRRTAIEGTLEDLTREYVTKHGIMPTKATQIRLAQQATLATRPAKEKGRILALSRIHWMESAVTFLGSSKKIEEAIRINPAKKMAPLIVLTDAQRNAIAEMVILRLEDTRARWNYGRIDSTTSRVTRLIFNTSEQGLSRRQALGIPAEATIGSLADIGTELSEIARLARTDHSVSLRAPDQVALPAILERDSGSSIYRVHGAEMYTSTRVLAREAYLMDAGLRVAGPRFDPTDVALAGAGLSESQITTAQRFASSGRLLDAAVGPAGAGKTTTMRAFARGVEINRGRIVALAPSAVAASVLGTELNVDAETVAKFLWVYDQVDAGQTLSQASRRLLIDENTIVLVDEAGMTSTKDLAAIVRRAETVGASVRLIGDPSQLDAVEGGGALRLFDRTHGAAQLVDVHRFADPAERDATLALRAGKSEAADYYVNEGRVHGSSRDLVLDRIYDAWVKDNADGNVAVMVSGSNADVKALNERAQRDRIAVGEVMPTSVSLHDGTKLGVGDRVVTRTNNRMLRTTGDGGFVKNGDVWNVDGVLSDGTIRVQRVDGVGVINLPAPYVTEAVELAYASTIHRVQGMTVARSHTLVTDQTTREQLYVAMSRGRLSNSVYVVTDPLVDADLHAPAPDRDAAMRILRTVIAHEGAELSATETYERDLARSEAIDTLLDHYEDVLHRYGPPVDEARANAVLVDAFGIEATPIQRDVDTWPSLAARLSRGVDAGEPVSERLREHVDLYQVARDVSPGRYVLERLGEAPPGQRIGNHEIDTWLEGTEDLIRRRLSDDDAINSVPRGRNLDELRRAWGSAPPTPPEGLPETTHAATANRLRDRLTAAKPERTPRGLTGSIRGIGDALGFDAVDDPRQGKKPGKQL